MNYKVIVSSGFLRACHRNAVPIRGVATPQLPLEVHAPEFAAILGERPKLMLMATGFGFTEGPVYFSDKDDSSGYLIFTDQLNDNINMIRWNGLRPFNRLAFSPGARRRSSVIPPASPMDRRPICKERLLTAETTGRRVSITEPDGTVHSGGNVPKAKPLNSPNDLVVKSDGTVWFTDPSYGCLSFLKSATCQTASIDLIQRMET